MPEKVKKSKNISRRGDLLFHSLLLVWPVLQFCVFYIGVNFNSFRLAFEGMNGKPTFEWFANLFDPAQYYFDIISTAFLRSLKYYATSTVISVPLALLFAFYIYKKHFGSKFFRLLLFLPSILSSMVMVVLFNRFVNGALIAVIQDINPSFTKISLFSGAEGYDAYVIFFNILIGFGTTVLIYSNSMGEISPEVTEAAHLDGANTLQEIFHIVLPSIYSNISVFIVTGLATIFVNQYNLFSFFKDGVTNGGTLGYYIYLNVSSVAQDIADPSNALVYHQFSALGLVLTAITIPITFLVRYLLRRFGPSTD